MASDLGTVASDEDGGVRVYREPDGTVLLFEGSTGHMLRFPPAGRDQLRELFDRAAMPGQDAEPVVEAEIWCGLNGCINGPGDHQWHVTCQSREEAAGLA